MKIIQSILYFLIVGTFSCLAQTDSKIELAPLTTPKQEKPVEEYHAKDLLHQIYLEQPVKSLDGLEYEKDGEKLKGKLSEDGKRVIIENYHKRGRIKATVTLPSGEQKTVSKSSCYVDIVIPL